MTKPKKTFRLGRCSASVFVNAGKEKPFRSVSLQRRYREGEKWKTSTSFTLADLPDAVAVLQLALHYLASEETSGDK